MEVLKMADPYDALDRRADRSNALETVRELATHASDIKHLQEDMDKMLESMQSMQKSLSAINSTLSEAKGGWKVLMMVGGASGALAALAVKLGYWYSGR
jgi:prefoldin subunit 5